MASIDGNQSDGDPRGGRPASADGLRRALEAHCDWPSRYVFKFIVPAGELNHLLALLDDLPYSTRNSRSGRFFSVTCEAEMASPGAVIEVYRRMSAVRGLMAL